LAIVKQGKITASGFLAVVLIALSLVTTPETSAQNKKQEQEPQNPEIIKLDTALVTVPVVVTDRYGRFIAGLSRQDFNIREDGTPQSIAAFSSIEEPFNVALLIDTSRSTRGKLSVIRKAALEFIKQLQPNDRVLIATFDEEVKFIGDFSSDRRELEQAIRGVKSSYGTSLYDAIDRAVREKLLPLKGRKAIVLLTDGVDTWSKKATSESTLELVSNTGIPTYGIQYETRNEGSGPIKPSDLPPSIRRFQPTSGIVQIQTQMARDPYLIAAEFMRALALQSGARHLRAESIDSTFPYFTLIAAELRHQYTLAYYPTNETRDGRFRTITVGVKHEDLVVRTRRGYRVQN
jgi:Ca-activated chloride channel family protein